MIPLPLHRCKGGAAQLGVALGEPGPFGTWSPEGDDENDLVFPHCAADPLDTFE